MWGRQEWSMAINRVAAEVLLRADYQQGSVDGLQLARRLGFDIFLDRQQASRGRLKQFGCRRSIFLKPEPRSERMHWAVCHELGEGFAHRVFHDLGAEMEEIPPGMREQAANWLASRLLLPEQTFFSEAERVQESLTALKSVFHTASYELIATRLLDQPELRCVTIFDQGRLSKRLTNLGECGRELLPAERLCWETSHQEGRHIEQSVEQYSVNVWAIHEPQWKREIVITRPLL